MFAEKVSHGEGEEEDSSEGSAEDDAFQKEGDTRSTAQPPCKKSSCDFP
jgi:hypothetical protein